LVVAQASANKTNHWLNTALEVGLGAKEEIEALIALNLEVRKMLSATIKTLRRKNTSKSIRDEQDEYGTEE